MLYAVITSFSPGPLGVYEVTLLMFFCLLGYMCNYSVPHWSDYMFNTLMRIALALSTQCTKREPNPLSELQGPIPCHVLFILGKFMSLGDGALPCMIKDFK